MSDKVRELAPFLITLNGLSDLQRRKLLKCCNKRQIRAFQEICLNICKKSVPLNDHDIDTCRLWWNKLAKLAARSTTLKAKKKILIQKGGFLPALLPIIGSVLASVLMR